MNLAKSLHTITVYERLISYLIGVGYLPTDAVIFARQILGHDSMSDTYGLIDKAQAKAEKNHRVLA